MPRWIPLVLLWLCTLAGAFLTGAFAYKYRSVIRARMSALQGSPVIQTNLYNLRVQKLAIPGEGRDGAIDVLGDGLLLVNRRGQSWFITKDRTLQPLALRVPINDAEFEADPYNAQTTDKERFSVKDILVQQMPSRVRVTASFLFWHKDKSCNTLRVASTETTRDSLLSGRPGEGPGTWRTLLETRCHELDKSADGRMHHVTLGAGGRIAALSENQLLVTVGEFTPQYDPGTLRPEIESDMFRKTMLIDVAKGTSTPFTRGHRNPQGLAVGPDGRIWLTEHAARGGDELNLLEKGKHYGAPFVTYGTQYEMMVWPLAKVQGKHEGYTKPVYSWVPSIATSQLVVLRGDKFPWWSGDLIVSALESRNLYHVRVEDDRVIFVEPITIGHRVRDIVETSDGSLALKTDDDFIVFLDNLDTAPAASLDPVTRGSIVAGQCTSCHSMAAGAPSGIGPNLHGVVGRRVASSSGYAYSDALKRVGGTWTPDRLRAFVSDPGGFAPGNRMGIVTKYTDQQLTDLLSYLQTLK